MRNGNVLKNFIRPKAEPYLFPDNLEDETPAATQRNAAEDLREGFLDELFVDGAPQGGDAPAKEKDSFRESEQTEEPLAAAGRIQFANVQAEAILAAAKEEAEQMKAAAGAEARTMAEKVREDARREGYREGYAEGIAGAEQDLAERRETQAAKLEQQLQTFLENIALAQDELMDDAKTDMRDLAVAVAEKVVRISLKSSSGVIAKMIQDATEKMKKREWVHIYVSGCDAKGLAQITPRLTRALSGLSDHIRIIPVAEEEGGTCIIETPDAIIDASAPTQMANIRAMLENISPDDGPSQNFGRRPGDR
ncbi:FliH/SctL family protein [Oscillibacter sp.]|uniref:FliH/SctL family protein n=1 Tax=Oscillibacter sp. TaxID=1945593 RepID=UPI00289D2BB2|nr:FliH/SctL family protein [Oscillibacter sp.]